MHILHVVGARPNFMKAAPVLRAVNARGAQQTLVHTGQHYDANMSDVFFQQLEMPAPDVNLEVGSGTHAQQTADIMTRFEPVVRERKPDLVLVYGDVNSTIACALVSSKLGVRVGHVEAGLRSFDRTMPEEINRVLTDQISDVLFTPSHDGNENLLRESVANSKIFLVGNVMIDTLVRLLPAAEAAKVDVPERYVLVTLHRPANVDDADRLRGLMSALKEISNEIPVVFPVHPRTKLRMENLGIRTDGDRNLRFLTPAPYIEFLAMQKRAAAVVTDSGGVQEETTFLGVPCLTFRPNTERPVTITDGTNTLIGTDPVQIIPNLRDALAYGRKRGSMPLWWDGKAAERIADIVLAGKD